MIYAYIRISTDKQFIINQKEEILNFVDIKGLTIDKWVTETISGKVAKEARKLGRLLKKTKKGDTIIITEISRLSRTLVEIMEIMGHCLKSGVKLYSIKEGYSFDDSINSQVLCFAFGLTADIERRLISMRTKEALAVRKAAGVQLGRRPGQCPKIKVLHTKKDKILTLMREGKSISHISRELHVARATMMRFVYANAEVTAVFNERIKHQAPPIPRQSVV